MNEQDFNRINEIAKELNDIRLRNNLSELQLIAEHNSYAYYGDHEEWNQVMLITRGYRKYKDCKIVRMEQDEKTNEIKEMDYNEYLNYK